MRTEEEIELFWQSIDNRIGYDSRAKIKEIIDDKLKNYYCYQDPETLKCTTLDKEKRLQLGQFYTPGKICITMIEMYETSDFSNKNILDPCCGSGNLLIAMLCVGADTDKVFGNDYDSDAVKICRGRIKQALQLLGRDISEFKDWQIHQGNALHEFALKEFRPDYEELYFDGKTQSAARTRRLEDPKYDAYKDSELFKKKCKLESDNKRSNEIDKSLAGTLFE